MTNQANVDHLTALIKECSAWSEDFKARSAYVPQDEDVVLAEFLAARGVLVPSALTYEQCRDLSIGWDSGHYFAGFQDEGCVVLRTRLEKIARGEP